MPSYLDRPNAHFVDNVEVKEASLLVPSSPIVVYATGNQRQITNATTEVLLLILNELTTLMKAE